MKQCVTSETTLLKVANQLITLSRLLLIMVILLCVHIICFSPKNINLVNSKATKAQTENAPASITEQEDYWIAPDISTVTDTNIKEQLAYGKKLITHTSDYFGAGGIITKNSTNGMNCQNCHLEAGTKAFGINFSAVFANYPKYRARSGNFENIYKRVNDCFERSLNGKTLDTASSEMQAIVAYINFLGKNVPKGAKTKGSGFKDLPFLDRVLDPKKGQILYKQKCVSCHQVNGAGLTNTEKTSYTYPPLWGKNSYNDGAGLYRMSNFAKYVKNNMPFGVRHNSTLLTDEEAWDIAAYVNSQPRPKKNNSRDWPKMTEKPFDLPFGPYKDGFTAQQHKYGPFKPIIEKLEEMKKQKEQAVTLLKK